MRERSFQMFEVVWNVFVGDTSFGRKLVDRGGPFAQSCRQGLALGFAANGRRLGRFHAMILP
jgi:hypothetical protein